MRKSNVIFFYSKKKEKELEQELGRIGNLKSFPLDESLQDEHFDPDNSLVVICDSSKEEKGVAKLKEIKRRLPNSPLFLMAQNASREYLMTAISCKVADFFPLPVDEKNLLAAIGKKLKARRKFGDGLGFREWWSRWRLRVRSVINFFSPSVKNVETLKNLEVLGIMPHQLAPFFGKELESESTYDLSIQFFGRLNIVIRGQTVPKIKGKKNAAVLAYLLFHHHKSIHRDILMDRFWGNSNTASAKNSLNVSICSIRKDLARVLEDQEVILYENESYCINPNLEIITDVEKFIYFWKKGRAIEAAQGLVGALAAYNKAVALYQEEFLENFRFEDWCESERDNLREIYLFILNRLSVHFFDQKNYYACINICKKMLLNDDCLEEVHRKLMKCYFALGLTDMAFKQYFKCKKVFEEELDRQPSKSTEALLDTIRQG